MIRKMLLFAIRIYQKTFSPDHGPMKMFHPNGYCKYTPSCSEYGYRAIQKKGAMMGICLALWRVLRCNPWGRGGIDDP